MNKENTKLEDFFTIPPKTIVEQNILKLTVKDIFTDPAYDIVVGSPVGWKILVNPETKKIDFHLKDEINKFITLRDPATTNEIRWNIGGVNSTQTCSQIADKYIKIIKSNVTDFKILFDEEKTIKTHIQNDQSRSLLLKYKMDEENFIEFLSVWRTGHLVVVYEGVTTDQHFSDQAYKLYISPSIFGFLNPELFKNKVENLLNTKQ